MINRRRSKPFEMISLHEDSYLKLEPAIRTQYGLSRDFSLLPIDEMRPKPTIFKVNPLQAKYDNMIDTGADFNTARAIFQTHVTSVKNFTDERGRTILEWKKDGKGGEMISDDSIEDVPRDVIEEVVGVCVSMARQDTRPFTMPDSLPGESRKRLVLASFAKAASTEPAKE